MGSMPPGVLLRVNPDPPDVKSPAPAGDAAAGPLVLPGAELRPVADGIPSAAPSVTPLEPFLPCVEPCSPERCSAPATGPPDPVPTVPPGSYARRRPGTLRMSCLTPFPEPPGRPPPVRPRAGDPCSSPMTAPRAFPAVSPRGGVVRCPEFPVLPWGVPLPVPGGFPPPAVCLGGITPRSSPMTDPPGNRGRPVAVPPRRPVAPTMPSSVALMGCPCTLPGRPVVRCGPLAVPSLLPGAFHPPGRVVGPGTLIREVSPEPPE